MMIWAKNTDIRHMASQIKTIKQTTKEYVLFWAKNNFKKYLN